MAVAARRASIRSSRRRQPAAGGPPLPRAAARAANAQMITPELYARCFRLCRDAIKQVPGHGDDQVLTGAVAPWNNQAAYPGNPTGDWVIYFQDILALIGSGGLDGMTLHTYTHGSDPGLIYSQATMNPPFANRHYNFIAYQDFMQAIPPALRSLPVYITETDQDVPWLDANNGWVRAAYREINRWNQDARQSADSLAGALSLAALRPVVHPRQTGGHRRFQRCNDQ